MKILKNVPKASSYNYQVYQLEQAYRGATHVLNKFDEVSSCGVFIFGTLEDGKFKQSLEDAFINYEEDSKEESLLEEWISNGTELEASLISKSRWS